MLVNHDFIQFLWLFKVSVMETPTRAEPVPQEDKTKLLKAAFLQFCRYVDRNVCRLIFKKQNMELRLFPDTIRFPLV